MLQKRYRVKQMIAMPGSRWYQFRMNYSHKCAVYKAPDLRPENRLFFGKLIHILPHPDRHKNATGVVVDKDGKCHEVSVSLIRIATWLAKEDYKKHGWGSDE